MLMRASKSSQRGITLFLALVILVALMMSGIALFRTADSSILVAGNIAMQKSATRQGDQGSEHAIERIAGATPEALRTTAGGVGTGYVANGLNDLPSSSQTWASWWDSYTPSHAPYSITQDSTTGNQVSYLIQRLCAGEGKAYVDTPCSGPPQLVVCNSPPCPPTPPPSEEVYFRITSRITGPNNAVSFIQTIVSY